MTIFPGEIGPADSPSCPPSPPVPEEILWGVSGMGFLSFCQPTTSVKALHGSPYILQKLL